MDIILCLIFYLYFKVQQLHMTFPKVMHSLKPIYIYQNSKKTVDDFGKIT
jgi:hypothetical protein